MKALYLFSIVSLSLAALSNQAMSQEAGPSANSARYGYGVVDVTYIFKHYQRFTTSMDNMKKAMESADGQLKSERDTIAEKEQVRTQYNPGAPEFKQIDEEIARLKAEFQLKAGKIRRDFLEREAQVYYSTYQEVSNAVQYYAQQHNIGMVLRFNGDAIDPNNREDILRAINKPVVFQNNVDITPDILALLNRGGTPGGTLPAASAGGGTLK
ncbi:OmpH family outer membrane protein [Bythopirellula goksoeyrii]|uniref:Outer membrane protein (OmpH-like) n=1 Tax=Bythopirellula goksoeyrii TaxID=1400387 RepID=A0A5B9QDJ7_9BACT|nr:OmpH family outer membrane protein [Bythopirellula goksoeyrii]QEG35016.1 Outer membrane protein (OmpH-like) [Bythopirellula goksoeyrii]